MNLRSYQFTWDLIPFTPNRANLWSAAIKQLRLFMHPTKGTYGYLTPKLFKVKIYAANKVIFSSELSALTSLVVNPFGSGPAFHKDGNPVHTILTTEFQEIVTLTTDEISKLYP
jgi:hypothetical protein